jgi:hypothetical protein
MREFTLCPFRLRFLLNRPMCTAKEKIKKTLTTIFFCEQTEYRWNFSELEFFRFSENTCILKRLKWRNVINVDKFFFETTFYLQYVYINSANWCEDWVLWLGEGHSVVPFRSY